MTAARCRCLDNAYMRRLNSAASLFNRVISIFHESELGVLQFVLCIDFLIELKVSKEPVVKRLDFHIQSKCCCNANYLWSLFGRSSLRNVRVMQKQMVRCYAVLSTFFKGR